MFIANFPMKESEDSVSLQNIAVQEVDAAWIGERYTKPGQPAEKTEPVALASSLVIARPESFSFQEIEGFLFKRNITGKPATPKGGVLLDEAHQGVIPGNVVQSTALQFSRLNGAGVVFASDGAPESLSDQAAEMRSLVENNSWKRRPLIV